MLKPSSGTTRRFVYYMLHPRPTPIYPRLGTRCRYRQSYRKALVETYDRFPQQRRPDSDLARVITQSFVARLDAQSNNIHECHGPFGPPARRLRSYRTMKHRSIRDFTSTLEKRRREYASSVMPSTTPPGRTLRRAQRMSCYPGDLLHEVPPPGQLSSDSSEESSGSAHYVTARSAFSEPSDECQIVLQVLDTHSGILFHKVRQGSKGTLRGEQLDPDVLDNQNTVAVKVTSPVRLPRNAATDNLPGLLTQSLPSVMLTLPTPQLPTSPVFIPKSPITVNKFISAASRSATPILSVVPHLPPAPPMAFCPDCSLVHPNRGELCYSCDQQWLACKVWYQANDGGHRQRLREPYIKPAESNAANRSLMEFLQAPTGYGLGIRAAPDAAVSRSRFKKLAPLLAMVTADSSMSMVYREEVHPLARRIASALNLRVLGVVTRKLWAMLAGLVAYNFRLLGRVLDFLLAIEMGYHYEVSDLSGLMTEEQESWDDEHLLARATRNTSRFLEHLSE